MSELTPLESLFRLVHLLKRQLHQQIEALDLAITPMHVRVMKIVHRTPQCTANGVGQWLNRDKAQVTRLISTLIDQQLLVKTPNPQDKRSQYLTLTESGRALMGRIDDIDGVLIERMTRGMSPAEQAEFQRLAGLMADNLGASDA
ncbi:MarR family winged helix-turn-helix transcriptional regulator [Ferrimonas balearica]|uniref:MarR family winged helix-turn-helix transcriptional regulator n=1 Tax=Ferrimonas balearica TaxID=44012 RepID=UPI001C99769B|nr:MarR family transcriptional regulator [Ferrimonas balearica]MBY5991398.1 MarR family transcriptional regulator [Ferrimonas balearica]